MPKFYFLLWVKWAIRITLCSVALAFVLSFLVTFYAFVKQGMPAFTLEINRALLDIFKFWFSVSWNFTLLLSLFRSIKYIFNKPLNGYKLVLKDCKFREKIEVVGYGDLVKVWRKWFMLLIWLSVVGMIFTTITIYLFGNTQNIFVWFKIEWLYGYILIAGYFSFILLSNRCKRVKVVKC